MHKALCSEEARRTTRNYPRVRARYRTDSTDDMLAFRSAKTRRECKLLRNICSPKYANNCVSRNNVPELTPGASWTHLVRCPGRLVRPPSVTRGLGSSHWWCSGMAGGSHSTSLAPGTGSAPSSPLRYNCLLYTSDAADE